MDDGKWLFALPPLLLVVDFRLQCASPNYQLVRNLFISPRYIPLTSEFLNFPRTDTQWINLGLWTSVDPLRGEYADACQALCKAVADFSKIPIDHSSDVLDVGNGNGDSSLYFSSCFGCSVTGVNAEPDEVARANSRGAKTILASATSVITSSERCSHVLAIDCIYHFNTRERFLKLAMSNPAQPCITYSDIVLNSPPSSFASSILMGRWNDV